MRSLLTLINDESLLNRIKLMLNDSTIKYYFAPTGEEAANIASANEIAVVILDYINPVMTGPEICEMILSYNPDTQFIMLFDEKYTKDVIEAYNELHINKLICKEHMVLEDVPSLIESCLYTYNRDEEIDKMDEHLSKLNDMYLHPMDEMSSILNERLIGYDNVIKVFKKSLHFTLDSSDAVLKSIDNYVDNIINDYIQLFMTNEPNISDYYEKISESFNDPEGRKYFKFVHDESEVSDDIKCDLLFALNVITKYFDTFYQYYRGKVTVALIEGSDSTYEINALYEVRKNLELTDIYDYAICIVNNILKLHTLNCKYGQKNSILQFKAVIGQNEEVTVQ